MLFHLSILFIRSYKVHHPPTTTPTFTELASPTSTRATFTPSPTSTPTFTPLPTPTSTPEPFDESYYGILVADFVCGITERELCLEGANLAQTAHDDLIRRIERENMSGRVAVRRVGPVSNDTEAKAIGEQYGARLVVWGYMPSDVELDSKTFVPSFTLVESDEKLIAVDPVIFGVRISGFETLELSQQLSARVTGVSNFILAMVYLTEGQLDDYEQAVRILGLSIAGTIQEFSQIDKDDPRRKDLEYTLSIFYATRGRAYAALGDEINAYDDYQTALEYNLNSTHAQCGLGNYYFARGELDAAYEAFEQARRLDPTLYRPHYGLAIVAYAQGNYDEAETRLKHTIELASAQNVDPITVHFALGLTYLQLGNREKAETELQRVLSSEKAPQDLREVTESYLTPQPTLTPVPTINITTPTQESGYPLPTLEHLDIIGCNVTLRWSWPRNLADDEWFSVRLGLEIPQSIVWTKEYEHTYPLNHSGTHTWEIAVCLGNPAAGNCEQLAVSEQNTFLFRGCAPHLLPTPTFLSQSAMAADAPTAPAAPNPGQRQKETLPSKHYNEWRKTE